MKFSVTLVVFLLFLAAAFCYVKFVPPEAVRSAELQVIERVLPLEEGDAVTGIKVEHPSAGLVQIEKDPEGWNIEAPFHDSADESSVEGLVAALTLSSKARRLKPEKGWDELGLAAPSLRIGVKTQKRSEWRTLEFGDAAPVGSFVFARWEGEAEYFLIDANVKRAFERGSGAYRQKKIFRVPLAGIRKIRTQQGDKIFELARSNQDWLWMEPVELLGNSLASEALDRLLAELGHLYIKEFLDEGKARQAKEFGLADARSSLTLWAEGDKPAGALVLGHDLPEQDAIYARREGEEGVFLVSRGKMQKLFEFIESLSHSES